jgi:hypothetical protein
MSTLAFIKKLSLAGHLAFFQEFSSTAEGL